MRVIPQITGPNNYRWKGGSKTWRGAGWQLQKRLARERDGHKCVLCEASGKRLNVDHIKDKAETGGVWDNSLENLQTLCAACHARKHGLGTRTYPCVCRMCGKEFSGHVTYAILCSRECRLARERERDHKRRAK